MAQQPYIGEITMFSGNFAPMGWAFCDGSIQNISDNDALFNLIGTTFGGDGQSTFALPDLRSRVPIHAGTNPQTGTTYTLGQSQGVELVILTTPQMPAHSHALSGELNMKVRGADPDNQVSPVNNGLAIVAGKRYFSRTPVTPSLPAVTGAMGPLASNIVLANAGSSQAHTNVKPYLAVNFIISLFGVFPSQT